MKFYISYPHELRKRREELGLTLTDLAQITRIDYTKLEDAERGHVQMLDAPIFEALIDGLDIDGEKISQNYFTRPLTPEVTRVAVHAEMLVDYLRRTGENPNSFGVKAGVPAPILYGFVRRSKRSCKAKYAYLIALGMGVEPSEFAPGLALYKPEGI